MEGEDLESRRDSKPPRIKLSLLCGVYASTERDKKGEIGN